MVTVTAAMNVTARFEPQGLIAPALPVPALTGWSLILLIFSVDALAVRATWQPRSRN